MNTPSASAPAEAPVIGIVMGSNSDWPTMQAAARVLAVLASGQAAELAARLATLSHQEA